MKSIMELRESNIENNYDIGYSNTDNIITSIQKIHNEARYAQLSTRLDKPSIEGSLPS